MAHLPRALIGAVLGLAASTVQGAENYYLWYDENGQAVYSQIPPPDGRQTDLVRPPPPPAEPEAARQRLQERLQQFEDQREDEELAARKAAEAREQDRAAEQRCATARRNLEALQGPARSLFRMPDGQYVRLTEEERESRRAEMRKVIDEDCR